MAPSVSNRQISLVMAMIIPATMNSTVSACSQIQYGDTPGS
jgi:hypothetical protein